MENRRAALDRQYADVRGRIRTLFEANEELWQEIGRGTRGRSEALPLLARNADELVRLGQQEKVLIQQLLQLEAEE